MIFKNTILIMNKMNKKRISKRDKFLKVYQEFNQWLIDLGYRNGHFWKEASTFQDIHYSHYGKHIDSLHGVECYIHDILGMSLRLLRDRHEHLIMFTGKMGRHTDVYTLGEAKELILNRLKEEKQSQLNKLNSLNF